MLRRRIGVALVAVLVGSCSGSSSDGAAPAPRPPGTEITDGFVVAPGSQLVGTVFSYPAAEQRGVASRAIVSIDRDPVKVYDEYVAQARRHGILIRGSGTADVDGVNTCTLTLPDGARASPTPPGSAAASPATSGSTANSNISGGLVAASPLAFPGSAAATRLNCIGGGARRAGDDPATAAIELTWGGLGHHAVLSMGPNYPIRLNDVGDARATSPAHLPKLSDAPLATEPGTPFGPRNNGFDRGYRRFTLEEGSSVVAEVDGLSLLHIDGDAHAVMKGYAAQLGADGREPEVREQSTSRGKVLTIANAPQGGGAAFLLTDPSGKWLLVETSSD